MNGLDSINGGGTDQNPAIHLDSRATGWMGDDGFVERSYCEIRRRNLVGNTLHIETEVAVKTPAKDGGGGTVRIEQRAHNQDGELSDQVTAAVRLPA